VRRGQVSSVVGRVLAGAGILILAFVAYQLWGTKLAESHSQDVLRQRFDQLIHRHTAGATTTTTSPTSSPTTTPSTVVATTAPIAEGDPVGVIQIPKIGVNQVVVQGTNTDDLRMGPGHYPGTPMPGQMGNAAIAGHRTTYGAPFYNLDQLSPGDTITVQTQQGQFVYNVTQTLVVSPDDVAVVAPTATPELTLTTCNPRFSAAQRLVVHAALVTPPAASPAPASTAHSGSHHSAGGRFAGLGSDVGSWLPAFGWGVLLLAIATVTWVIARLRRGARLRWLVYALGTGVGALTLFFFFGAVSPLLPASF
jgi:sortase A